MNFDLYVGIDYSGAATSATPLKNLQVFSCTQGEEPTRVPPPSGVSDQSQDWTRQQISDWLISQALGERRVVAGLDHAFSFPLSYFKRHRLTEWNDLLAHVRKHWPTHVSEHSVKELVTKRAPDGDKREFRLTECWTSSAKSVFRFGIPGQVGPSTFAGIPWLGHIREVLGSEAQFWPFDGWDLQERKSVIAEVYPSIFHSRYSSTGRSKDEHDAYSIARWLRESDERGILDRYFNPPLTPDEKAIAEREGWILGIC